MTSDAETYEKANQVPDSVPSVKVKDFQIVTRDKSTYELLLPLKAQRSAGNDHSSTQRFSRTYLPRTYLRAHLIILSPRTDVPGFMGPSLLFSVLMSLVAGQISPFRGKECAIVPSRNVGNFWSSLLRNPVTI